MNENIDLTEILKDCPKGTKLCSPLFGYVELKEIVTSEVYSVNVKLTSGLIESFTREGKLDDRDYYKDTECVLFPSKDQRDWSKFTAPGLKKERDTIALLEKQGKEEYGVKSFKDEDMKAMNDAGYKWNATTKTLEELIKPKFDPKTLKAFDRVLVRDRRVEKWRCDFFSYIGDYMDFPYVAISTGYNFCIPTTKKPSIL